MNRMHGEELRQIVEEAAVWHELLPTATQEQQERFLDWLQISPLHVRKLLAAIIIHQELRNLDPGPRINVDELAAKPSCNVVSLDGHRSITESFLEYSEFPAQRLAGRHKPPVIPLLGWAVAVALPALIIFLILAHIFAGVSSGHIATNAGERKVMLADGSSARVAPHSQVSVDFSDRHRTIHLIFGEALFEVAQSPRPFVVNVPFASVRALGTKFSVKRMSRDQVMVTVAEGSVVVAIAGRSSRTLPSASPRQMTLFAGQRVAILCGSSAAASEGDRVVTPQGICRWLFLGDALPAEAVDPSLLI